jgi:hypothetical protein
MKVVKALEPIELVSRATGKPQQRRVAILQRDDGHFSFAEEYSYTSEWEGEIIAQGWSRLSPEGIFGSAEIAEAEADQDSFKGTSATPARLADHRRVSYSSPDLGPIRSRSPSHPHACPLPLLPAGPAGSIFAGGLWDPKDARS